MSKKVIKVAITGAAGQIGYALIFRIASGEMFGSETDVILHLLELPQAMSALEGVAMELHDCAFPPLKGIVITSDCSEAFKDVDWALLVGSVPRKVGMERSDLLKINGGVFINQGKALFENAKTTCKVLVVGNPCNTNAFIAKAIAKNIPEENFFALTMLDQNRAVAQLAQKAKVDITNISKLAIWGNHSATQYPDFTNALIQGKPVAEMIVDQGWLENDFLSTVQKRGAAVIGKRGLSSAASAANAVIDTVKNIIFSTPVGEFFSVAVSSDGSYGIEKGIMFSFPVRSDGKKWTIVQNVEHNEFSKQKIKSTYEELLKEKEAVLPLLK